MTILDLIDDVVAAVDIEGVASNQPRGVMGEESRGQTNVHNIHEAARRRLRLCFLQKLIEFRDPGCGARRERTWRNSVNADALGTNFSCDVAHGALKGSLRDDHGGVVSYRHLA